MAALIGIAGPSCAGKTELARWLSKAIGAPMLNLDHYYRDLAGLSIEERAQTNFDEPASVDHQAILEHAHALVRGEAVHAPQYDFSTHARRVGGEVIVPAEYVILEGLFTLYWPELRDTLALKVFVEAPDEVCFARRLRRDTEERGRTEESVRWQFETTVRPMAHLHILPSRLHADLVLSGTESVQQRGNRVLGALHL
jgi:uridine kinase